MISEIINNICSYTKFDTFENVKLTEISSWKFYLELNNMDFRYMKYAIRETQRITFVKFLYTQNVQFIGIDINNAIVDGFLYIVRYLYEIVKLRSSNWVIDFAISKKYLDIVRYLHKKGKKCSDHAINYASEHGDLNMVIFLTKIGKKATKRTMHIAIKNNYIEMVKYLHSIGIKSKKLIMNYVCSKGYLELAEYLHSIGKLFTYKAMLFATANNHLDVMKFLHSIGCKYNKRVLEIACEHGYLEIVIYLRDRHDIQYTKYIIDNCCENGNVETIKYLYYTGATLSNYAFDNVENNNNILIFLNYLLKKYTLKNDKCYKYRKNNVNGFC